MEKKLPARPNLDHLKRQAKEFLAAWKSGDAEAASTFIQYLPAAKKMSAAQARKASFRLADAQAAIARKHGFSGWPHLSRHIEQLRAMEGDWRIERLELDGTVIGASDLRNSRILMDGDRFRTESMGAQYEGIFNINVEADPHEIDLEFVEGPEAGNRNYGIFRLEGDQLEICMDIHGKARPTTFSAPKGTGHAYETLTRASRSRPENVTGGKASRQQKPAAQECAGFEYVESPTMTRLQGEWTATQLLMNGQGVPEMMLRGGRRLLSGNEVKVTWMGQTAIHALIRLDESVEPAHMDYYILDESSKGAIRLGLMKWVGEECCFCMAEPGQVRPTDFTSSSGSGRTLSQWKAKK